MNVIMSNNQSEFKSLSGFYNLVSTDESLRILRSVNTQFTKYLDSS